MVNRKAVNVPASMIRRDSNQSNVSYTNYENQNQYPKEINEEVPSESFIP